MQVAHALDDGILEPHEEHELRKLQYELGLSDADVARFAPQLAEARALYHVAAGSLPVVAAPPGVILKRDEVCHFGAGANLLTEVTTHVYTGRSAGVSVRIMKGVSVRTSGSRGRRVPVQELVYVGFGPLLITSQRTLFLGPEHVSIPHGLLVSVSPFGDGFELHHEKQRDRLLFQVDWALVASATLIMAAQRV